MLYAEAPCCLHWQLSSDSACLSLAPSEVPLPPSSSIPGMQQQQWCVKPTVLWAWYQWLKSKLCSGESYSMKRQIHRWGKIEQATLETQHLPLPRHTTVCRWKVLPKTRKGKGGCGQSAKRRCEHPQHLVGCSYTMWTLFRVSQDPHMYQPLQKYYKVQPETQDWSSNHLGY